MTTNTASVQYPITYNIIHVKNIDVTVSSADISKLFGFHETTILRKSTCVEIIEEDGAERYAKVVLPNYVYEETMKFNGVEYYNKKLIIEDDDADETPSAKSQGYNKCY